MVADGAVTLVPSGLLSRGSRSAVVVALLLDAVVSRTLAREGVGPLEDPRLLVATSRALGPALVLTAGSLLALHALAAAPSRDLELVVLVAANAVAALLRSATLRRWFPGGARRR